ncbi:4Fe-4S binding protein [bacterium]|nr:4Fe-4S binding protein [bacterium]
MLTSVKEKKNYSVTINQSWCKGCYLCIEVCPIEGIFIKEDYVSEKGFPPVAVREVEKCTGCQLCELLCPDLAIIIKNSE